MKSYNSMISRDTIITLTTDRSFNNEPEIVSVKINGIPVNPLDITDMHMKSVYAGDIDTDDHYIMDAF